MGDAKVHGGARRIDLQPGTFPATQDVSTKSLSHSGNTLQVHRRKANLPGLRENHGQTGSNANVADGGTRKGTRSDEIRPIIRPWPLPPLRPKRAASGVAGLRYGSRQRKTNHALMSETSAGKPQPEAIPLNI